MTKWGMVIDLEKCTGCQACTTACAMENSRLPGESWQDVLFYHEGTYPNVKLSWLPRPCMQCENPSCVAVCPTKATYKTEDGVVLVDWDKCIGCKYCMIACPYGVRFYMDEKPVVQPDLREVFPGDGDRIWNPPYKMPDHLEDRKKGIGIQPKGVVSKCTFCYHKISKAPKGVADLDEDDPQTREYVPACVRVCPPRARYFGDLDNPNSRVNQLIADKRGVRLKEETGNKPQVYYLAGGGAPVIPGERSRGRG
ncbi:MAG: 4Fe-4S dicluster domain-containing protein [Geminicoccaceae bacterium]|nr:4Fe-4S dicluster domain-containing protein [Geminicoccaceae bacterium]